MPSARLRVLRVLRPLAPAITVGWSVVLLALPLLAASAVAQERKRLVSRAAFARLDSSALADSAALRPLNPRERFDSLMLEMVRILDAAATGVQGTFVRTSVRRWDGYSTHAHPTEGILVDREEIDALLDTTSAHKRAVSLPRDDIERRLGYIVQFVMAHEYAHLLQYDGLPRDSVERPELVRVLECAADIHGAALHQYALMLQVPSPDEGIAASAAVSAFGYVIGGANWLDGTTHPLPETRRHCISVGQAAMQVMFAKTNHEVSQDDSARTRYLAQLPPEFRNLYDREVNLLTWSVERARVITAEQSVTGANLEIAVTRDTSVLEFLRVVAPLAVRGKEAIDDLRGAPSSLEGDAFVLRRSLPLPWRCELHPDDRTSAVLCTYELRTTEAGARQRYEEVAAALREAVGGGQWFEDPPDPMPELSSDKAALGFRHGTGSLGARVKVSFGDWDFMPVEQLMPKWVVSLEIVSGR